MKKKFSKILGIGLTLALMISLLLTAVPVSALSQPAVTVTVSSTISEEGTYSIVYDLGVAIEDDAKFVITFPTGTDLTNVAAGDLSILATSGIGSAAISAGTFTIVKSADATTGPILTATIATLTGDTTIGVGATVQLVVEDVINPDTAGSYTLTVATQTAAAVAVEAAVTSAAYTIAVPTVTALAGVVKVYNPTDVLMTQKFGASAIQDAIDAAGIDYTIKIGPGTYTEAPNTAHTGVTFVSTGTTAETIIVGAWTIDQEDTTLDGLTLDGDITVSADDFILQNSVLDDTLRLATGATDAAITSNTFNVTASDVGIEVDEDDATITSTTFTIPALGVGVSIEDGGTDTAVTDSTFNGTAGNGINVTNAASVLTVKGSTLDGLLTALAITDGTVIIDSNTISNSTGDAIDIAAGTVSLLKFNSITDSTGASLDTAVAVDATLNWWGTSVVADIAAKITGTGTVDTDPSLTGTAVTVIPDRAYALAATALDSSTTVGVRVVEIAAAADTIVLAKYASNPQEALADAVAFYDVYVGGPTAATDDVSLRFYTGDTNSLLYVWSRDTDQWVLQTASFSVYGGYIHITVDADLLDRTPFAVTTPPVTVVAPTIDAPRHSTLTPVVGAVDVSLSPTFSWEAIAGADAYYFEFSTNAEFVIPIVKLDGDKGRHPVTAYHYAPELNYNTTYYWRVKAVSGTAGGGNLVESAWVSGVITTVKEPVEVPPPIVVKEAPVYPDVILEPVVVVEGAPEVILQAPDVIVTLPAETPVTPAWIYVIIGVGAVLVIALLVLIVRTRRVA